jgi:methanogenic corrinoid protein MtbC1
MPNESIYQRITAAIIAGDKDKLLVAVEEALRGGMTPSDIIDRGLSPGMREVGERFARYEVYLPEMMMAAEAWEHAMKVIEPKLLAAGVQRKKAGRVVIGTVSGDVHSIGKNIVAAMLKMSGFESFDLGIDVAASAFIMKAEEVGADVIAASALMTTTMPQQKNISIGRWFSMSKSDQKSKTPLAKSKLPEEPRQLTEPVSGFLILAWTKLPRESAL